MQPAITSGVTLAEAFPALVSAIDPALHALPLATARRLKAWSAIVQTFALSAARRRDLGVGELVAFPLEWVDRELVGEWSPPGCRIMGARAQRTLARAGLRRWREVLDRTPQQLLEGTGAGLMILSDILSCAIELAAAWTTQLPERRSAVVFGVSRKNYSPRTARA